MVDDLFLCDADMLAPCNPAAFEEAALTLLFIMAVIIGIGIALDQLRRD